MERKEQPRALVDYGDCFCADDALLTNRLLR
jgi:hypothetical protein